MPARPIQLPLTPAQALGVWPAEWPLAALWSGDPAASRSRWTVLARPSRSVVLNPRSAREMFLPPAGEQTSGDQPAPAESPPFQSGWIGFLSYDLGRVLEPRARDSDRFHDAAPWPIAFWSRCDDAVIYDHLHGRWWLSGSSDLAEKLCRSGPSEDASRSGSSAADLEGTAVHSFALSSLCPTTPREAYLRSAARVLDYIRAGDIYQANLAHALTASFSGSARGLFAALTERARPWYGAYLEFDHAGSRRAMLSLSPELFLSFDSATRRVETRPMKGTRAVPAQVMARNDGTTPAVPPSRGALHQPSGDTHADLETSEKDRAELNMIIDLLRNDLGRVCDFGSVRVEQPRAIEQHGAAATWQQPARAHPALLQATATITGRLRDSLTLEDLLRATFPGGSITGAPKIRAMQIIDELEPGPRGPYCGSIGFIADTGHAAFNIAIRTALITAASGPRTTPPDSFHAATLSYSVGAGIVADSVPESEWRETLDKASIWSGLTTIVDAPGTAGATPLPPTALREPRSTAR